MAPAGPVNASSRRSRVFLSLSTRQPCVYRAPCRSQQLNPSRLPGRFQRSELTYANWRSHRGAPPPHSLSFRTLVRSETTRSKGRSDGGSSGDEGVIIQQEPPLPVFTVHALYSLYEEQKAAAGESAITVCYSGAAARQLVEMSCYLYRSEEMLVVSIALELNLIKLNVVDPCACWPARSLPLYDELKTLEGHWDYLNCLSAARAGSSWWRGPGVKGAVKGTLGFMTPSNHHQFDH